MWPAWSLAACWWILSFLMSANNVMSDKWPVSFLWYKAHLSLGSLSKWRNLSRTKCFRLCRMGNILLIVLNVSPRQLSSILNVLLVNQWKHMHLPSTVFYWLERNKVNIFSTLKKVMLLIKHYCASSAWKASFCMHIFGFVWSVIAFRNHNDLKLEIRQMCFNWLYCEYLWGSHR